MKSTGPTPVLSLQLSMASLRILPGSLCSYKVTTAPTDHVTHERRTPQDLGLQVLLQVKSGLQWSQPAPKCLVTRPSRTPSSFPTCLQEFQRHRSERRGLT